MTQPERRPAVGFIGLGDQGAPIARAIAEAGYPLNVWARRPASLAALDGVPHTACGSAASVAAASEAVDAPVSGGHAAAAARQLTTIAGGRRETVEGCAPVFRTFSKTVIHLGATGTGQLGTLFNDALMLMNRKNIADILAIAQAVKLDLPALLEVLRSGSASSAALLALGSAVTASNAKHLQKLELIDVDLFARAVATQRDKAAPVIEQALAGAETLPNLTTLITANTIPN